MSEPVSNTLTESIENLIRATRRRALQESLAALIVIVAFGWILQNTTPGSSQYYGCLIIMVSGGFITGVVWSYALNGLLLEEHPAEDAAFWHTAFLEQARLLSWVPAWYLGPLGMGLILFWLPFHHGQRSIFWGLLAVATVMFGFVGWLNRRAARQLATEAEAFAEA